jgi:hypothetical protein
MDVDAALDFAEERFFAHTGERFNDLQKDVFKGAWQGLTYQKIADFLGYSDNHIKDEGARLCQLLSEALGEEVTKLKFRAPLERGWRTQQSRNISSPHPSVLDRIQPLARDPNFVGRESVIANTDHDLSQAPDVSVFYGRTEELTTLEQWIVTDRCRLVALWGMGGIGKTALAVKLAERVKDEFEYVIWRSLQYAQPVQDILVDLLEFFCYEQETALPDTLSSGISRLIKCLQAHRCLVVLDGVETILATGQLAGTYREGYQEYGRLFRQVGELNHQSCLVLTSSEKSREIRLLESKKGHVRSQKLNGLQDAARQILRDRGLVEEDEWSSLIEHYRGNPLSLRIVSPTILDLFNGKASAFLSKNTTFVGGIHEVLDQAFERLSSLEIEVMCQLSINQEPVTIDQLREGISSNVSTSKLIEALESLGWRSLIEQITECGEVLYTLQPVVRKYVINRFG